MRNNILLIGSGYQDFREYALKGLAESCGVILLSRSSIDWQLP